MNLSNAMAKNLKPSFSVEFASAEARQMVIGEF